MIWPTRNAEPGLDSYLPIADVDGHGPISESPTSARSACVGKLNTAASQTIQLVVRPANVSNGPYAFNRTTQLSVWHKFTGQC